MGTSDEHHITANNGVIVGADRLTLDCVSNSSQSGVGMITGLDGNTLPTGRTGVWNVIYPYNRPGVVRLHTSSSSFLTAADQGIYTCTIPDNNDNLFTFNFGLYPTGFTGELQPFSSNMTTQHLMMISSLIQQILPPSLT